MATHWRLLFVGAALGCGCLALSAAPQTGAASVSIRLHATAQVGKDIITVGDVATVSSADAKVRDFVEKLDLDERPTKGDKTVIIRRQQVLFRARVAGLDAGSIRLEGALQCRVVDGTPAKTPAQEKSEPLVKTRELVRMVVRIGMIRVTAVGEALQDGQMGQSVRVRNVDSKAVVVGRVVERGVIEVQ